MKTGKYLKWDTKKGFVEIDGRDYENTYDLISSNVDGMIELTYIKELEEEGIDVWCNEEGKLDGLEPSLVLVDKESDKVIDVVMGNLMFSRTNEEGATIPLEDGDFEFIRSHLTSVIWGNKRSGKVYVILRYKGNYLS